MSGPITVTLLPPEFSDEVTDIDYWLQNCDSSSLARQISFHAEPSDSFHVPFGWVPIMMRVSADFVKTFVDYGTSAKEARKKSRSIPNMSGQAVVAMRDQYG